jgi:hypothetical protein
MEASFANGEEGAAVRLKMISVAGMLPTLDMVTSWSPVVNDDPTGPYGGKVRVVQLSDKIGQSLPDAVNTTLRFPAVIVWALEVDVVNTA